MTVGGYHVGLLYDFAPHHQSPTPPSPCGPQHPHHHAVPNTPSPVLNTPITMQSPTPPSPCSPQHPITQSPTPPITQSPTPPSPSPEHPINHAVPNNPHHPVPNTPITRVQHPITMRSPTPHRHAVPNNPHHHAVPNTPIIQPPRALPSPEVRHGHVELAGDGEVFAEWTGEWGEGREGVGRGLGPNR